MNGAAVLSAAGDSASKVCARLHQAYRDYRLYPEGHPTTRNTMGLLDAVVESHLNKYGPLTLVVSEASLCHEGEEVYLQADNRDNLAFLMFRDGIRGLTVRPGVEPAELEALVQCLARAEQMVDSDHDLTTALWEHDLVHVELEAVDPFLEGDGAVDDSFHELRDTVRQRLNELASVDKAEAEAVTGREGGSEGSGAGMTREENPQIDQADLALTEEEIARGEWMVSHPTDPLDEFVEVLLEILGNSAELPGGRDAVLHSVTLVLERHLDDLDQDRLRSVLSRLAALESAGRLVRGTAENAFSEAATAERLSRMITTAAEVSPDRARGVEDFLAQVRGSIYPALIEALATSDDKMVRKTVLNLLRTEGGAPVEHIWPLMKDSRWYVVRNAVQLATASGDPALADHLEPLVHHPDERVRREVIRSLATIAQARCLPLLTRALHDGDSTVRILAVRGLARLGATGQFPAVKEQVESRDFETRSTEEVEAFVIAYAVLGGAGTFEALNKMWKRRMFGTRPLSLRLAAVTALGVVGGEEAERALSSAMRSGDPQLQRAAARAFGEAQARAEGAEL